MSSKYTRKSQSIHFKRNNTEIMIANNSNKIINDLFSSLLAKY